MIATISKEVATGRTMNRRDGFTAISSCLNYNRRSAAVCGPALLGTSLRRAILLATTAGAPAAAPAPRASASAAPTSLVAALLIGRARRRWRLAGKQHARTITKPIGAIDDDRIAGVKAAGDRDAIAITLPELHGLHVDAVRFRINPIDKRALGAARDRRRRHDNLIVQSVDPQPDIHELGGKQFFLRVVE